MIEKSNPLVSVLTPSFNMEEYLPDFFDSILNQNYRNIELILVDDGSTDQTKSIVEKYKSRFEKEGIKFKYIYQSNKGQAEAINTALKIFTGDFITWPDADDLLSNNSINARVQFLISNNEFGFVRGKRAFFKHDIQSNYLKKEYKNYQNQNIYLDLILEKTYASGGCYLVRSELFLKCYHDREIYSGEGSQNWQMILPVSYNSKCGNIDDVVYFVRERQDSYSRKKRTFSEWLSRYNNHQSILVNTTQRFVTDNTEFVNLINERYARKKMKLAFYFNDRSLFKSNYEVIRKLSKLKTSDKTMKLVLVAKPIYYIVLLVIKVIKKNRAK